MLKTSGISISWNAGKPRIVKIFWALGHHNQSTQNESAAIFEWCRGGSGGSSSSIALAPGIWQSASSRLGHYVTRCWTSQGSSSSEPANKEPLSSPSSNLLSSSRGRAAVGLLPTYLADARAVSRYCATSNPQGALQLGVAESQMLEDWLVPALNKVPQVPADAIYYQPTSGRDDFKRTMARYIETMVGLDQESSDSDKHGRASSNRRLQLDGLILGAGCNAVLENLCFTLADIGDTVLIPTPYYAAFEFDLVARAGLTIERVTTEAYHPECSPTRLGTTDTGVRLDARLYYPNVAALDAAHERAVHRTGKAPKILLLSHPMNPLGICYPAETVQTCIDWCRAHHVHLISDEIYAGSVYCTSTAGTSNTFVSALKLGIQPSSALTRNGDNDDTALGLGPYIHWVYALSKDLAVSGLRVGAAYTENAEIVQPMQKLNDLCQISSTTQLWTQSLLEAKHDDELWMTAFRRDNHARLQRRSSALCAILDKFRIPYLSPEAGLFVWIDLSQFLPPIASNDTRESQSVSDAVRERTLYVEMVQEHGLLLTPGNSMRTERPGFFRCVFTAASDDEFTLALQRLRGFFIAKGVSASSSNTR